MQPSSRTRGKHSFVPWLAAMLLGASAHAGWLIHELRDDHGQASRIVIELDHHERHTAREPAAQRSAKRTRLTRSSRRARARSRVRAPASADLDLWIEQTDRYRYSIDRRALEQVAIAQLEGQAGQLAELGVFARALSLAEPIELRNIQQGTQLWLLGLRNGDRLRAVSTKGEPELERVELELVRRGRPVTIVYELS